MVEKDVKEIHTHNSLHKALNEWALKCYLIK